MSQNLYYIKRPSVLNQEAPLLIMIHGYGANEDDLFSFETELPKELFIISIRAPYALHPYGYAWYAINFEASGSKWSDNAQALKSIQSIATFIDYVVEKYPVNKNNVSLLGFSQGSILSYAVALTYPKKVKNIIALSGYLNQELIPKNIDKNDLEHLRFFCSHGSVDQVIPVEWARQTPDYLKKLNIQHIYKEYPVGHGVAPENFFDFKGWLSSQLNI